MRHTKFFTSYEDYESWTERFESCADYEEIPTIVHDGWRLSADLTVECKSWKTALRRFEKAFGQYFDLKGWAECMRECAENGFFHDMVDPKETEGCGHYAWGIEEIWDGEGWYIYLTTTGSFADVDEEAAS